MGAIQVVRASARVNYVIVGSHQPAKRAAAEREPSHSLSQLSASQSPALPISRSPSVSFYLLILPSSSILALLYVNHLFFKGQYSPSRTIFIVPVVPSDRRRLPPKASGACLRRAVSRPPQTVSDAFPPSSSPSYRLVDVSDP